MSIFNRKPKEDLPDIGFQREKDSGAESLIYVYCMMAAPTLVVFPFLFWFAENPLQAIHVGIAGAIALLAFIALCIQRLLRPLQYLCMAADEIRGGLRDNALHLPEITTALAEIRAQLKELNHAANITARATGHLAKSQCPNP